LEHIKISLAGQENNPFTIPLKYTIDNLFIIIINIIIRELLNVNITKKISDFYMFQYIISTKNLEMKKKNRVQIIKQTCSKQK